MQNLDEDYSSSNQTYSYKSFKFLKEIQYFTRKVYSINDFLNDFTGFITGFSFLIAIIMGIFSFSLFQLDWIQINYLVKTRDNKTFDYNENDPDERI